MSKDKNYADVNSSYTVIFIVTLLGLSIFFGSIFSETRNSSTLILILYGLLFYFILDFIKQLYSPGQSVFLFAMMFIILPFATNWLLVFSYARLGTILCIGAFLTAGIFEIFYEYVVKKHAPRNLLKKLLLLDNKIDTSLIKISTKYIYLSNVNGIVIALALMSAYFALSYALLHR